MDPAAPYCGRHRVIFGEAFHRFSVFAFCTYLHFSYALAFRTYLREELLAVVAVNEQRRLGQMPLSGSATLPFNAYRSMRLSYGTRQDAKGESGTRHKLRK